MSISLLMSSEIERGWIMLGDILLRMVSALTVDDVKEMMRLGVSDDVNWLLDEWDSMATEWRRLEFGSIDSGVWADVWFKLDELRAALRD
jgi:hypothetical protein